MLGISEEPGAQSCLSGNAGTLLKNGRLLLSRRWTPAAIGRITKASSPTSRGLPARSYAYNGLSIRMEKADEAVLGAVSE